MVNILDYSPLESSVLMSGTGFGIVRMPQIHDSTKHSGHGMGCITWYRHGWNSVYYRVGKDLCHVQPGSR
jgi:hypothetical protein